MKRSMLLFIVLLTVSLISFSSFSCSSKPVVSNSSNPLSGKWELLNSGNSSNNSIVLETWEFLADGSYVDTTTDISGDKSLVTGSYKIIDNNHVEIITSSDNKTYEFSISGNKLTLSSDKEVLEFKK